MPAYMPRMLYDRTLEFYVLHFLDASIRKRISIEIEGMILSNALPIIGIMNMGPIILLLYYFLSYEMRINTVPWG